MREVEYSQYGDQWRFYDPPIFSKTLIDGTKAAGIPLLRRRANGEWQYRRLTEAESEEYMSMTAW